MTPEKWLLETWQHSGLTEEAETYLLRRGMPLERLSEMGIVAWEGSYGQCPEPWFEERHGHAGYKLRGCLATPYYSPSGQITGFEARKIRRKWVSDVRFDGARWNPTWLGLHPHAMQRIWDGGHIWIVEGLFDLAAMLWVVPRGDVVLATVSAALTDNHVEFLRRYARQGVSIVYDNDKSGVKGAKNALWELKKVGVRARSVPYIGGGDPGEIWEKGGARALAIAFNNI